jgi:hypothetical protein
VVNDQLKDLGWDQPWFAISSITGLATKDLTNRIGDYLEELGMQEQEQTREMEAKQGQADSA